MLTKIDENLTVEWQESGQGAPLIWLHAFPQTAQMYQAQQAGLSDIARVLCPNLRGFGSSQNSSASTCSIDGMADDIARWMEHLQIENAVVGGVSMGGYVALILARCHPDKVRALILADTRADADDEVARANRATMIAFAREHSSRDVFEKMAPKLFCENTRQKQPQTIENCAQIAATIPRETIISTLGALRDRPDSRPFLAQITMPTLIIVGAEDEVSSPEVAREMSELLPQARLQVLADAGHLACVEQVEAFNYAVSNFLNAI